MDIKDSLIRILKSRMLYVVLVIMYLVNSAMSINRVHNTEELDQYYGHTSSSDELVEFALLQLGKPYQFGGKGPDSFDCSGFTGFVFKEFDIRLPVSASRQALAGKSVEKPIAGDLVFFANTIGINRIDHVGIVISNDQEEILFIHSSTSKGIMIDNLTQSDHYSVRFKGARRVL